MWPDLEIKPLQRKVSKTRSYWSKAATHPRWVSSSQDSHVKTHVPTGMTPRADKGRDEVMLLQTKERCSGQQTTGSGEHGACAASQKEPEPAQDPQTRHSYCLSLTPSPTPSCGALLLQPKWADPLCKVKLPSHVTCRLQHPQGVGNTLEAREGHWPRVTRPGFGSQLCDLELCPPQ